MNPSAPDALMRIDIKRPEKFMSRNGLYAVIAILAVVVVGYAIYAYQQEQSRPGIEVRVDGSGISIDGNG